MLEDAAKQSGQQRGLIAGPCSDLQNFQHVVGFEAVLRAISQAWASPFSQRAYAWRQAHMDQPQHVYPAVLLMQNVPVDTSGVMVTQDIETGVSGWLSVAVNEGVGGAVNGQAAGHMNPQ